MKTFFTILFLAYVFVYIANPVIKLQPFSISFKSLFGAFGWLFLGIGLVLLNFQSRQDGILKGKSQAYDSVIKIIKNTKLK
jgi:hypothetical protein